MRGETVVLSLVTVAGALGAWKGIEYGFDQGSDAKKDMAQAAVIRSDPGFDASKNEANETQLIANDIEATMKGHYSNNRDQEAYTLQPALEGAQARAAIAGEVFNRDYQAPYEAELDQASTNREQKFWLLVGAGISSLAGGLSIREMRLSADYRRLGYRFR